MKNAWNLKGLDPYHWVMTGKESWNTEDYYATGKESVDKYITPLFEGVDTSKMRAIAVGCGTGRMVRYMKFGEVMGTDVSDTMIEKAKEDNPGQTFYATNGVELPFANGSFDFVFSYATLQHFNRKSYALETIKEMRRILKPGGKARINVRGFPGNAWGRVKWWKSFEYGYAAIATIRHIPVVYFRFYDSLFGVPFKERELPGKVWREDSRKLWIDL